MKNQQAWKFTLLALVVAIGLNFGSHPVHGQANYGYPVNQQQQAQRYRANGFGGQQYAVQQAAAMAPAGIGQPPRQLPAGINPQALAAQSRQYQVQTADYQSSMRGASGQVALAGFGGCAGAGCGGCQTCTPPAPAPVVFGTSCTACGTSCGGGCGGGSSLFGSCGLLTGGGCSGGGCGPCGDPCGGGAGGCGVGTLGRLAGLLGMGPGGFHDPNSQFMGFDGQGMNAQHGPFGDGGCCAPRHFDIHFEAMYMTLDSPDNVNLASDGILGPVVLGTGDLDLDSQLGFRATANYIFGPGSLLEFTYFGTLNWATSAQATSATNNLFSLFSDFGSLPLNGFPETGAANLHRIEYSTELDSGEINLRRRWTAAGCLLHGSYLAGARYIRVAEDMNYLTQTAVSSMDYRVGTDNDMVGAQLGGDVYVCLTPRLKLGFELEAGLYGVRSKQSTTVTGPTFASVNEFHEDTDLGFAGEGGVIGLFRLTPRLTLRGGYQMLFLSGIATAEENFNTASPFAARTSSLANSGEAFYHGGTVGLEWTW